MAIPLFDTGNMAASRAFDTPAIAGKVVRMEIVSADGGGCQSSERRLRYGAVSGRRRSKSVLVCVVQRSRTKGQLAGGAGEHDGDVLLALHGAGKLARSCPLSEADQKQFERSEHFG
jgi:hypothetical protein